MCLRFKNRYPVQMLDPYKKSNRPYFENLARKKRITRIILWTEHFAKKIWRPFFLTLFFCGLWMMNIPSFFGRSIEIISPLIFIGPLIYFMIKDIRLSIETQTKDIHRALERASNLPLGTINALKDKLSNPEKQITRNLWNNAQQKLIRTLQSLQIPNLNIQLHQQDPTALRYLAILSFICGLMVSGSEWKNNIINGLIPVTPSYVLSSEQGTNLWITPPGYTGITKIHLGNDKSANDDTIKIPEGSKIRIRLYTKFGNLLPPLLKNGNKLEKLDTLGKNLYGLETTIENGKNLIIKQGPISRVSWNYEYIIDTPPHIMLDEKENKTDEDNNQIKKERQRPYDIIEKGHITVPLIVKDDYGVKDLKMVMELDGVEGHLPLGDPFEETRLIMSAPNDVFKISPVYNLTWHSWAGLPITLEYTAIDHKEQIAKLDKIHLTLPEREFEHPMAQSLITMRKRLAWDYDQSFKELSKNIEALLTAPDYFQHDSGIFLNLKSASSRLYYNDNAPNPQRIQAAKDVINILWQVAISIEDGNLSLAMRELRDARRALENAMRNPDASEDKISRLMDNLRDKMQEYFMEMQRELQKRMAEGENIPLLPDEHLGQIISPDAISKLMTEIESALRDDDEQKAQELMSKLQRMMEMLDPDMMAQMPSDMQMMQQGINELQELIERQEALLEQTKKQADAKRQRELFPARKKLDMPSIEKMLKDFGIDTIPPTPPQNETKEKTSEQELKKSKIPTPEESKTEQDALRYILGQLMLDASEEIGEIPESMGLAEQEMRHSSKYLGENEPHKSISHQDKAIEYLKQAKNEINEQLEQRMQQMIGIGFSGDGSSGGRRDPLGRPMDDDQNDVKIPDESQKKRADEILRMLRDRSGDRSRPQKELDYFHRLLRQF